MCGPDLPSPGSATCSASPRRGRCSCGAFSGWPPTLSMRPPGPGASWPAPAAAGLGWGAAGVVFFSQTSVPWQMILSLILAGVAMAAVPVLAPLMTAFLAFAIPALLPITAQFFLQREATAFGMGIFGVLFGGGLALQRLAHEPGDRASSPAGLREPRSRRRAVGRGAGAQPGGGERAGGARSAGAARARAHGGSASSPRGAEAGRRGAAGDQREPPRADRVLTAGHRRARHRGPGENVESGGGPDVRVDRARGGRSAVSERAGRQEGGVSEPHGPLRARAGRRRLRDPAPAEGRDASSMSCSPWPRSSAPTGA